MQINYEIPLWGIIGVIIVPFLIWLIVSIFNHKERIKTLENSHSEMQSAFADMKETLRDNKNAIDSRLKDIETTMTETKTMVKLLVDNRIKPGP